MIQIIMVVCEMILYNTISTSFIHNTYIATIKLIKSILQNSQNISFVYFLILKLEY